MARAEAYLHAKFHLDPSNRLATVHERYRPTGQSGQDRTEQTNGRPKTQSNYGSGTDLTQPKLLTRQCRKGEPAEFKVVYTTALGLSHLYQECYHRRMATCRGVNNLPKVVTRQRGGWESNSQPSSCQSDALTTRLSKPPILYSGIIPDMKSSALAKKLAGKNVSEVTYFVSSGT